MRNADVVYCFLGLMIRENSKGLLFPGGLGPEIRSKGLVRRPRDTEMGDVDRVESIVEFAG